MQHFNSIIFYDLKLLSWHSITSIRSVHTIYLRPTWLHTPGCLALGEPMCPIPCNLHFVLSRLLHSCHSRSVAESCSTLDLMDSSTPCQTPLYSVSPSSVQSLSCGWLFVTPWIAARQASLSFTSSKSPPKPMSIESVMPSNHLILCRPYLLLPSIFPASGSFPMSRLFAWGGQSIGVSASTSVLPMNTQDWSPLGWTGWISFQSKGLSRVFSNTTVQNHYFFSAQFSL